MTPEQAASELAQRIREADNDALLAAEAFAFGLHETYLEHRQAEIVRRIRERFGEADTDAGSGGAAG